MKVYSTRQIRAAEAATGDLLTSGGLMKRAATGLAMAITTFLSKRGRVHGSRLLVVAGPGNNGGDALYAAAMMPTRGVKVLAWRTSTQVHEGAWDAFLASGGQQVDALGALAALADTDLIVDGVLGIGGRGGLPDDVAVFADACRDVGVDVMAVDLPSGLMADSCRTPASFSATTTVTFGGLKACQVQEPARSRCGEVQIVDIGLTLPDPILTTWEEADVAAHWPVPGPTSDKYARGVVGVDAGSSHYPGAAVLACLGATYGGAGMVRYLGSARDAVIAALPNVVLAPGRVQAHLVGSGWGGRPQGKADVAGVLATGLPTVVDADALGLLPDHRLNEGVLLTPHAGELARLLGIERRAVEDDPVTAARTASEKTGAVVLLKGATQYVAEPSGRVTLAVPGVGWTGQAGSGDVLAGLCAAMLAAGRPAREAALLGASIQALAARAHPGPIPPQEAVKFVPEAVMAVTGSA